MSHHADSTPTMQAPDSSTGRRKTVPVSSLVGARLPSWAPYARRRRGGRGGAGLRALFGWEGWYTSLATAVLLFVIGFTAWSFAVEGRRRAKDRFASTLVYASFVAAVVPLVLILFYIGVKGFSVFSADFFTTSMNGVTSRQEGGGLYHALIGTLELVLIASVIALPIGIFTAIYLVEYGRGKFAKAVTFFVDVMTGVPSIVAGLFVYTFLLLGFGLRPFGIAGALALAILMIPVAVRSSEEMLKLVPRDLREASYALGCAEVANHHQDRAAHGDVRADHLLAAGHRPDHRGDRAADPARRVQRPDQLRPVLRRHGHPADDGLGPARQTRRHHLQ